jgi:hypothetical protein
MKYRIIIERISDRAESEGDSWSVVGGITINQTNKINQHKETRFDYSGYWLDRSIDGDMIVSKRDLKGFVESWSPNPFLMVFYKILYKELQPWMMKNYE